MMMVEGTEFRLNSGELCCFGPASLRPAPIKEDPHLLFPRSDGLYTQPSARRAYRKRHGTCGAGSAGYAQPATPAVY